MTMGTFPVASYCLFEMNVDCFSSTEGIFMLWETGLQVNSRPAWPASAMCARQARRSILLILLSDAVLGCEWAGWG